MSYQISFAVHEMEGVWGKKSKKQPKYLKYKLLYSLKMLNSSSSEKFGFASQKRQKKSLNDCSYLLTCQKVEQKRNYLEYNKVREQTKINFFQLEYCCKWQTQNVIESHYLSYINILL
jgi:hypothetical protein